VIPRYMSFSFCARSSGDEAVMGTYSTPG
jgi:hypothetical protein